MQIISVYQQRASPTDRFYVFPQTIRVTKFYIKFHIIGVSVEISRHGVNTTIIATHISLVNRL